MIKKILLFLVLFWCIRMPALAMVELSEATVRDDSGIQITFVTPSGMVEEKIRIVFPEGYLVDNSVEFSTDNLPNSVSPVPINGSKVVSSNGLVVELPINDLIRNTKYGLNVVSGARKSGNIAKPWHLATISNGVEDAYKNVTGSQTAGLTITARTPPLIKNFSASIISNNDGNLPQDHEVEFTITYGSDLPYIDTGVANLVAEWNDDLGIGLWNYVLGSAEKAYNDTLPIIDLVNNRIVWNIRDLPKYKTDHQVKFKLRSNKLYNGDDSIKVSVLTRITRDKLSTPDSIVNLYYKKLKTENQNQGPTSVATPTISPTPAESIGNTTTIGDVKVVELNEIDSNNAKIELKVEDLKKVKVKYGLNENSLLNEVTLLVDDTTAWLEIPGLEPGKAYFMQVEGSNDVFSFKTAEKSEKSEYDSGSLIMTSQNNIVLASKADIVDESAVLVKGQEYSVRLGLNKSTAIKEAKLYVRNKKVLGANSETDKNSEYVKLLESERGVFVGNLTTPKELGEYEIYLRLVDYNGNISEKKVGQIKIIAPLIVRNSKNQGVEKAKVVLSIFNQTNNIYEEIKPSVMSIKNPVYTESNGEISIALPKGKYRAKIEALGYEEKEVFFEVGWNNEQKYPEVFLDKKPFSIGDVAKFYNEINTDISENTSSYIDNLAQSYRFFYLIMTVVVAVLIGLSVLSLSFKVQIPVWLLPVWLWFSVKKNFILDKQKIIEASVVDEENGWPLSRVRIFIINTENGKILAKTYSDRLGSFTINKPKCNLVKIVVFKKGWEETRELEYKKESLAVGGIRIEMRRNLVGVIEKSFKLLFIKLIEMAFEFLLVITILFELVFVFKFGVLQTMPFLLVSVINLLIWLLFVYKMTKKKRLYEKVA